MYAGRPDIFGESSNNLSTGVERHAPDKWLYPSNEAAVGCGGFGLGAAGAAAHAQLSGAAVGQPSASKLSAAMNLAAQSVPAGVSAPSAHLPTWSVTSRS
tara:strand:- start:221 stop:520 length:300 start_codon:yes stop_codon:yes gene_type:complete